MRRVFFILNLIIVSLCINAQTSKTPKMVPAKIAESYIIYNVGENCGVVVMSDDQIVCYTDKGNAELAMRNPVFKAMIEQIDNNKDVNQKIQRRSRGVSSIKSQSLALKAKSAEAFPEKVGPLLADKWHQYYEPYNLLAPVVDSTHCVSGCVASAMAQVMHYWKHPEHGFGSYTYEDSLGCEQTLTADFQNHYYDWDNMLNNYENVDWTDAQGYAVAQLMYDCGVSVDMKYGVGTSGAASVKQPRALSTYFGYDVSAQMHYRDFYSIEEWTNMFKAELAAGRPILVSGYNYRLGHAFVCDGYDENDFFHFSFGNPDGAGDGFFYLPFLTPDMPPSQNYKEPESGFNLLQSMVTHLVPCTHPDANGIENHLFALSGMKVLGKDSVVVNNLGNVGWNLHNDSVALALVHNDEIVSFPYVYDHDFLLEELDDTVYTDTLCFSLKTPVEDGVYKLMPMYKDNGEWIEARTIVGVPNYLVANVKNDEVMLSEDSLNTSYLTLESLEFPDWLPLTSVPDYSFVLRNHNAEFCGRVYVLLENVVDSLPAFLMQEQGLTLAADEAVTTRFYHTTRTVLPGTYNVHIYYDHDLFSADMEELTCEPYKSVVVSNTKPDAVEAIAFEKRNEERYGINGVKFLDGNRTSGVYIKNKKKYIAR